MSLTNRVDRVIDQFVSQQAERLKVKITAIIQQLVQKIGDFTHDMSGKVIRVSPNACLDDDILRLLAEIYSVAEITTKYHSDPDADYCGDDSHYTLHFGNSHSKIIAEMEAKLEALRKKQ